MTSTLVQGAAGIFTGLPGAAMRATGAIRIVDGRIAAVGSLEREPGAVSYTHLTLPTILRV